MKEDLARQHVVLFDPVLVLCLYPRLSAFIRG